MGGFANIEGWQFGTVTAISFAGRTPTPRWNVECTVCGSRWQESHQRLTEAGGVYRCRNVSCSKGLIKRKALESKERDPESLPTPEPVHVSVSREYQLYSDYMKQNGFSDTDVGTWDEWQRLGAESRKRLLQPALIAGEAALKRRELEALGLALEAQERERMRRQYGF
jgi:hypothetical protein